MAPAGPELDADRNLALAYVPGAARPAIAALWRLDAAMGAVLAGGREPLISRIKLAWWRESLERLDSSRAPAEPVLQELERHVLPAGLSGAQLSLMEEGWSVLVSDERLTSEDLRTYASTRGGLLFRYSAALLRAEPFAGTEAAGEAWALADLARHSNAEDAASALAAARSRADSFAGATWPARLRPLGMLAVLAARDSRRGLEDIEVAGSPARMLRMLRHRLGGR